tara:strand:+ start:3523 stop:3702 length:180 start_codon:yes stop_codon:yes gene_type:complete
MKLNLSCAAEEILVTLRDGKNIVGICRSFDQFGKFSIFSETEAESYQCLDARIYISRNT